MSFITSEDIPIDTAVDNSGITLRVYRARKVFKSIKKRRKNNKSISFNVKFPKFDFFFKERFNNANPEIKNELMWAWEEIGLLNKIIDKYEKTGCLCNNCCEKEIEKPEEIEELKEIIKPEEQKVLENTDLLDDKVIKLFGP